MLQAIEFNSGTELEGNQFACHASGRQCGALELFDGTMYLETDTSMVPVFQFPRKDHEGCLR